MLEPCACGVPVVQRIDLTGHETTNRADEFLVPASNRRPASFSSHEREVGRKPAETERNANASTHVTDEDLDAYVDYERS